MTKPRTPGDDVLFVVLFVSLIVTLACAWQRVRPPLAFPCLLAFSGLLAGVLIPVLVRRVPRAIVSLFALCYLVGFLLLQHFFPAPESQSAALYALTFSVFFIGVATVALVAGRYPSPTGLSFDAAMGLSVVVGAFGALGALLGVAQRLRGHAYIVWIAIGAGLLLLFVCLSAAACRANHLTKRCHQTLAEVR